MVNLKLIPLHRVVVLVWHVLILALIVWAFFSWRDGGGIHWLWLVLIATPILVLVLSIADVNHHRRAIGYWVLAATCIPLAASGLTSIVGWMFVVSVVMLGWAARREDPAEEMVQY